MSDPFVGLFDELCARRGISCALTGPDLIVRSIGGLRTVWGDLSPGQSLAEAVPELLGSEDAIAESLASGEPFVLPWLNRDGADGLPRYFELSINTRQDDPDTWIHWLIDVTGTGRLQRELGQNRNELSLMRDILDARNRDLQVFLRAAGHDLKAPLRTLQGFLELVAEEHGSPLLDAAQGLTGRLSVLVQDLLRYARLGDQAVELVRQPLVTAAIEAKMRLVADIKRRGATVQIADELPSAQIDATLFGQVVFNLIDNALKYVPADRAPVIAVGGARQGTRVRFTVEDNGAGVPPDRRAAIFDPLTRLHGRDIPGHGFGLATVQRCCQLMRGRVVLDDSPDLGGARFTIELLA